MNQIKALIVDDHPLVRDGLRARLIRSEDVCVIGEADNGEVALQKVAELQPDIVLMDINMPGMDGIQATEQMRDTHPEVVVLVLSMHDDREYVRSVIRAGARGYVLKSASADEMFSAIIAVHAGGIYYSPSIATVLLDGAPKNTSPLSERELSVLRLLAEGMDNKSTARALDISVRTVETHRRNIKRKLGLRTTPALIRYALDNDLGR